MGVSAGEEVGSLDAMCAVSDHPTGARSRARDRRACARGDVVKVSSAGKRTILPFPPPQGCMLTPRKCYPPDLSPSPSQVGKGEVGVEPGCPGPLRPPCCGCRDSKPTPIVPTSGGTEMGSARQDNVFTVRRCPL